MPTIDIRKLSAEQLKNAMVTLGEKPFRAKQVHEWLWKRSATSFADMTNLSKELRTKLEKQRRYHKNTLSTTRWQHD